MNFDVLLSHYRAKACVVSVEFFPDGTYGNIRVVAGNKAHCDDMAALNHPFEPGCPYEACFPKNPNFEDHCFRCIRDGKPLHAYVDLYMMGLWLNMFLMPLDSDQENIGYCIYCYDVAPKADSSAMADLSADTAADVLKACIKLRGSQNIRQAFQEVVEDIGAICGSDHCCVLLTDDEKHECTTFAEFLREGSGLYPMSRYIQGFYEIAQTWPDTLAGSTCIIIKDEHDMEKLQEQNPVWKASLDQAGVKTVVLYPLRHGGELLGYMWALNFNVENVLKIAPVAVLCVTGYYNNPPQEGLLKHYRTLSSETGAKIVIYNVPGRTSSYVHPDTLIELAEDKNIIGLKQAVEFGFGEKFHEDTMRVIKETKGKDFAVMSGEDGLFADLLEMGGTGIVSATGNIPEATKIFVDLYKAFSTRHSRPETRTQPTTFRRPRATLSTSRSAVRTRFRSARCSTARCSSRSLA